MSLDFHSPAKFIADLTRVYKKVTQAANVETGTEGSEYPENPEKLFPHRSHTAQRPRIDLGKTSKAVAAKILAAKLRSSRPGATGDSSLIDFYNFDLYIIF